MQLFQKKNDLSNGKKFNHLKFLQIHSKAFAKVQDFNTNTNEFEELDNIEKNLNQNITTSENKIQNNANYRNITSKIPKTDSSIHKDDSIEIDPFLNTINSNDKGKNQSLISKLEPTFDEHTDDTNSNERESENSINNENEATKHEYTNNADSSAKRSSKSAEKSNQKNQHIIQTHD